MNLTVYVWESGSGRKQNILSCFWVGNTEGVQLGFNSLL